MGLSSSQCYKFASYKDVQNAISVLGKNNTILINTLPSNKQSILIKGTCAIEKEEQIINDALQHNSSIFIIIYAAHNCDRSVFQKYEQLRSLGFVNIYIYSGGLFEWLCLQDIYGDNYFQTISKQHEKLDLLDMAPSEYCNVLHMNQITNSH